MMTRFQSTLPRGERHFLDLRILRFQAISIHAPTRGATIMVLHFHSIFINFNPRSHEGSDFIEGVLMDIVKNFNPRSHEGSDTCCSIRSSYYKRFQSTLPRGERQQFSPKSSLFSQQKLSKIFNLNNKLF